MQEYLQWRPSLRWQDQIDDRSIQDDLLIWSMIDSTDEPIFVCIFASPCRSIDPGGYDWYDRSIDEILSFCFKKKEHDSSSSHLGPDRAALTFSACSSASSWCLLQWSSNSILSEWMCMPSSRRPICRFEHPYRMLTCQCSKRREGDARANCLPRSPGGRNDRTNCVEWRKLLLLHCRSTMDRRQGRRVKNLFSYRCCLVPRVIFFSHLKY